MNTVCQWSGVSVCRDLERVSELEATLAPNASLMSLYLECHLSLSRVSIPSFLTLTRTLLQVSLYLECHLSLSRVSIPPHSNLHCPFLFEKRQS